MMGIPEMLFPYMIIGHALFNTCLFIAFIYQAGLGWGIRKNRISAGKPEAVKIRRHRKLGPVIAALLPLGYLAGLMLTYLHHGVIVEYPLHLGVGTLLVAAVISTWWVSKNIQGTSPNWRALHFGLGIIIILLFLSQIFLGLNVLL
jgi:hypothetical protein